MKLGIVTPVLTMLPRAHARWEEDADFSSVVSIAQAADRLGYHHITCSEHVAIPRDVAAVRGARYYDPLPTFGYLSACTSSLRFEVHVLVLGYHHPLAIAKRYGTLDRVSGGRLILGVGVGSLEEEFSLLGVPFAGRGERADDAMRALRVALRPEPEPSYSGSHYSFSGFVVDPCAVHPDGVPMWVGGRTYRSLRRAMDLGDGWAPFGLSSAEMASMLERARDTYGRDIDVVAQNEHALDPLGEPDRAAEELRHLAGFGATHLNARFVHHSQEHYVEQLEALVAVSTSI